jgi:SUKH-4 immunity protein
MMSARVPIFELVQISVEGTEDEKRAAMQLIDRGFPRNLIGREYSLLPSARVIESEGRRFIWFANCSSTVKMCVAIQDGAVVTVSKTGNQRVRRVNSSLDQFSTSVKKVISRFPFYSEGVDPAEFEEVANELESILLEIDSSSIMDDGFWSTFIEDVRVGDYATEFIES